jgi:tetratricopeptide (TPR) repeat protein
MNKGYISLKQLKNYNQAINDFTYIIELIQNAQYEDNFPIFNHLIASDLPVCYSDKFTIKDKEFKVFLCHYWRAESFFKSGNLDEAINDLTKCIEIDSLSYDISLQQADYYKEFGQYENALAMYEKCISVGYMKKLAYTECGFIYYKKKEYEKVIEMFTNILDLQLYTNDNLLEYKYEIIQGKSVQTYEGSPFDHAFKHSDHYGLCNLYYFRGRSYGELDQFENAIKDLTNAIELNSIYELAYYYRAYFYNYTDQKQKALKDFQKVLGLNPARTEVLYSIALIFDSNKDYVKALENYNRYVQSASPNKNIKYDLALDRIEKLTKHLKK